MPLRQLESAELSDQGRVRSNNEDDCLRLPELGVFCLADGMGGAAGGDLASETITTTLSKCLGNLPGFAEAAMETRTQNVRDAINRASAWIKDFADEKGFGQMGSTVVALLFDPEQPARAVRLHAGDSRLYRYRSQQLEQLTCDHTAGEALAAQSGQSLADIPARFRNELTRAVGIHSSVELTESVVDVRPGDLFLLCTDGLTRMVEDHAISRLLRMGGDLELPALAQNLIDEANRAGGKDNITVVLIRIPGLSGVSEAATHETQATAVEAALPMIEGSASSAVASRLPAAQARKTAVPGVVEPAWRRTPRRPWLTPRRLYAMAIAMALLGVSIWIAGLSRSRWAASGGASRAVSTADGLQALPVDVEAQILKARAAGDFGAATRLVDAFVKANPNDPRAQQLKAEVQEAQDLQMAQHRFRLGAHDEALRLCDQHVGLRQFDELAERTRAEAGELAKFQGQFAVGDYSFQAALRQQTYAEKPPFQKLLLEAATEAGILARVSAARRAQDWQSVLAELRMASVPGLTNKAAFREASDWAVRQNPSFVEPSAAARTDPKIAFERNLVRFGVLPPVDSFLMTREARLEKPMRGTISAEVRIQALEEVQQFRIRYSQNTSEYLYYSRSNYLDILNRTIQSWPGDARP